MKMTMSKKIFLPVMAFALTLASCDMDKMPYDSLPTDEAIETPRDFEGLSNGLYSGLRSCVGTEAFYNAPDIQADEFNAVAGFSGALNYMYNWTFNSNSSEVQTVYGNCQALISRANFVIHSYNTCDMSNTNLFDADAIASIKNVLGEAYFTRAWALSELAKFFCADYEDNTADEENSGVSYMTEYNPTMDASQYPARNTLRQTYKQITNDLDSAAKYVTAVPDGDGDRNYITGDAITALKARIALVMDNYEDAAKYATEVINTGNYPLNVDAFQTGNGYDFARMWWGLATVVQGGQLYIAGTDETDQESIFKIYSSYPTEASGQTGTNFQPYSAGSIPNYIPTRTVLNLYSDGDLRTFLFLQSSVTTSAGTSGVVYLLDKYTEACAQYYNGGYSEFARWTCQPKVLRIAEMYLIAAEAYAKQNLTTQGAQYLNYFMQRRISGYAGRTFADADELLQEVKNERQREFLGEGVRLFDLKRWHEDIRRGTPQQQNLCNQPGQANTTNLVVTYGGTTGNSQHYVWPIPQHEIDANPQIKQNPGY